MLSVPMLPIYIIQFNDFLEAKELLNNIYIPTLIEFFSLRSQN